METRALRLDDIRIDGDTQPRVSIDQELVSEYAEAMQTGAEFPSVEVYHDGATWWLADGFHRFHAAKKAGRKEIRARVRTGVQQDAQWASLGANITHGLRRTNADKTKAVNKAIIMRPDLSDREIAEHIGVHFNTVNKHRVAMQVKMTITKCDSRTGRDGRKIKTGNIKGRPTSKIRFRISPKAQMPVCAPTPVQPKRPLSMPCDPAMGARTLLEVFDLEYLKKLLVELQALLDAKKQA